jgi:hypothetical protein
MNFLKPVFSTLFSAYHVINWLLERKANPLQKVEVKDVALCNQAQHRQDE